MPSYVLLEKITVGAATASSVSFSNIPQTGYTDLVVKYSARSTTTTTALQTLFNNDQNSANYSYKSVSGNGASVVNDGQTNWYFSVSNPSDATASTFSSGEIYIPNYTSSNQKSLSVDSVTENNATAVVTQLLAGRWTGTAAINRIDFTQLSGSLAANSTFYLYGVAKLGTTPAISPYATGGDTIMTDGTYWYHTFLSSGTFTPQKSLSCDYLVIAGGGGGGGGVGGGGGAGGYRSTVTATGGGGSLESALSLTSGTNYTVTIGAGGAKGTSATVAGATGSNSVFSTITSTGGGGGGHNQLAGKTGGSGGGAGYEGTGGTGTTNQGYAGGNGGLTGSQFPGGGGGGAGQIGASATGNTIAGNGGNGLASSITGSSVIRAGGGGGGTYFGGTVGTGGTGGGTNGGSNTNATANTGSGGGGANNNTDTSGAGGSGIVIVRYAV